MSHFRNTKCENITFVVYLYISYMGGKVAQLLLEEKKKTKAPSYLSTRALSETWSTCGVSS